LAGRVTLKAYILRTTAPGAPKTTWVRVRNQRSAGVIARERAIQDRPAERSSHPG
jgi:hypothetical protein